MSVEERFVVKTGRFGAYFYDNHTNEEMDLAVVQWSLNLLWSDSKELQSRKISESSRQSTTVMQCPFVIVERFADNGEHSHWELVNKKDGTVEWSQHA